MSSDDPPKGTLARQHSSSQLQYSRLRLKVEKLLTILGPLLLSSRFHDVVFESSRERSVPARSDSPDVDLLNTIDLIDAERATLTLHDKSTGNAFVVSDDDETTLAMFRRGEAASAKEFLAYEMARPGCVPKTLRIRLADGSFASLQKFLPCVEDAEDYGYGVFSLDSVQEIAVLDLRILNLDRHTGNLMLIPASNEKFDLVGIDHELAFPTLTQLKDVSLCWTSWPQAKQPVVSPESVLEIDVLRDLERMASVGLNVEQQLASMMSSAMLKLGVARGLSLSQIGDLMQRQGDRSRPSVLERCFMRAVTKTFESSAWAAHDDKSSDAEVALEFAGAFREAAEHFVGLAANVA